MLDTIRHSSAHLLAQAVQRTVDPYCDLGTWPATDTGFYYDIAFSEWVEFGEKQLKDLTKQLKMIAKEPQTFVRYDCVLSHWYEINSLTNQHLKNELLDKFKENGETNISYYLNVVPTGVLDNMRWSTDAYVEMYREVSKYFVDAWVIQDDQAVVFLDLCAGPHIEETTKESIDANGIKLNKLAGAYRQADEKNAMMTRIYGLVFENKADLKAYEEMMEEAKKRDHRVLGKQLDLFRFSDRVGAGLPMFLPNGEIIKYELETYMREEKIKLWYSFVTIPHIAKRDLYETSWHMWKYDAMMPVMTDKEGTEFVMKAMNCPHHFELYNGTPHSYRDLPLRYAENTTCYRNEKTGELSGLTRVKCLTQDDTHHFVRHSQIEQEVEMVLWLMERTYKTFWFEEFKVEISVRDPNNLDGYFGDDAVWTKAEATLISLVKKRGADYTVEEWEAAFYWPKIDIRVKDSIGRDRQLTTVQLDFIQPENFDMTYTNENGEPERPAVLHVAILWSSHRFMWVMIEHFAGAFPVRLAPTQIIILPVAEAFADYAQSIQTQYANAWLRIKVDTSNDSLNKMVRNAEKQKIPYIVIVWEKEENDKTVSVREFRSKEQYVSGKDEFESKVVKEYKERIL